MTSLEETLKQKEAELAKLNNEYEDLKKHDLALSEDNKNLNDILNAKKDELNKTIAELRARLATREVDIFSLQKHMDELSQEKAQAIAEKEKSIPELKKTYDSMVGAMQEEVEKGEVTITQLKDKLTLSMVEAILFDSGSSKVKKNGEKVLDRVAEILKKVTDKQIRIEGYTDNVPIGGGAGRKVSHELGAFHGAGDECRAVPAAGRHRPAASWRLRILRVSADRFERHGRREGKEPQDRGRPHAEGFREDARTGKD
jgi:flagellar motor protein MotB